MQIGELDLLPAVREAERTTYVVADGFSCRTQIKEGTDRHPMHLSELILMALRNGSRVPRPYPERGHVESRAPILSHTAVALCGAAVVGALAIGKYLGRKGR